MKPSELLALALANYKNDSYMCHEIGYLANEHIVGAGSAEQFLHNKIQNLLAPYRTIVLHNLLRSTSKRYASYNDRYGYHSNACYKIRVKFWQDMIAELTEQGF